MTTQEELLAHLRGKLDFMLVVRGIAQDTARDKTKEAGEAIRRAAEVEQACAEIEQQIQNAKK